MRTLHCIVGKRAISQMSKFNSNGNRPEWQQERGTGWETIREARWSSYGPTWQVLEAQ